METHEVDPTTKGPAGDLSADVAERIKARIDVSWGRYLRCGDGWLALLGELDSELGELFPEYRVYQCKEKFGILRYYTDAEEAREPQCCAEFLERDPMPSDISWLETAPLATDQLPDLSTSDLSTSDQPALDHEAWDAWEARFALHGNSDEHQVLDRELREKIERAQALIRRAEERSGVTCEVCGTRGELTRENGWFRVRCEDHSSTPAS